MPVSHGLFRAALGMSGTYDLEQLFRFHGGEPYYLSAPLSFLPDLGGEPLDLLRRRFVLLTHGEGRWEEPEQSWRMAGVLGVQGRAEPRRHLGTGVGPRLADLARDAAALPRRTGPVICPSFAPASCMHYFINCLQAARRRRQARRGRWIAVTFGQTH